MGKQADAIVAALEREVANAAKALILEIDRNLRRPPSRGGTPVDTGHARASWVPSVGAPSSALPDGTSSADHDAGVAKVLAYALGQGALWLANNAPYVNALNYGHSKQAPAGFIERAIDLALQTVEARYQGRIDLGGAAFRQSIGGQAAENLASAYSPFGMI